jgi:phosphoribosylanthranilate isomerase
MKIKVCGILKSEQMEALSKMKINFIGINFYPSSPRYYKGESLAHLNYSPISKTGIFVNSDANHVIKMIELHGLNYVQLHGDETPAYCSLIAGHAKVIKAFPHYKINDNEVLSKYKSCELYLFDTASLDYGGSGKKFDWEILSKYDGPKPYLLAGGISSLDIEKIKAIEKYRGFLGVDINSKFEITPGIKDLKKIETFIKLLNNE